VAFPGTKGRGENGLLLDLAVPGREQRDERVALQMGAPHQSRGKTGGKRAFLCNCSSEQDSDFPIRGKFGN